MVEKISHPLHGIKRNRTVKTHEEALRMEHIVKVYPNGVMANRDVTFSVRKGEIHALSGENGAGKTTLMKILFGEEAPTSGQVFIDEKPVHITSPQMAISLGIGMVHQHFTLVPSLTAAENMILGMEPTKALKIDLEKSRAMVLSVARKYNLPIEADKQAANLSVGEKQKLEILKVLVRGARILILDEPTAVLTPQETEELFIELKALQKDGYTIIFISHKLAEVKRLCDRITIIRHGRSIGVYNLDQVTEQDISRMMVGRDVVFDIQKDPASFGKPLLRVTDLSKVTKDGKALLKNASFAVREGQILGIAGVEGNGQTQIVDIITGMTHATGGRIEIEGVDITGSSIKAIREKSVSHIPEDRMTTGVAPNLSVVENIFADKTDWPQFSTRFGMMRTKAIVDYGRRMVKKYRILCQDPNVSISSLSGGNIQKTVLARELSSNPRLMIANQPTRGVDVGSTEFIHGQLIALRDKGNAILLVSSDLNEILGLSDSIIVLFEGEITAWFADASLLSEEELGLYMLGVKRQSAQELAGATHA